MQTRPNPIQVVPVPDWIVRALYRNGLSLSDLSDYSRVSGILSVNDMAEWLCFYSRAKVQGVSLLWPDCIFEDCFDSLRTNQKEQQLFKEAKLREIDPSVSVSVKTRLERGADPTPTESSYRFMISGHRIYVSFAEGGAPWKIDEAEAFKFFKNYLKQCYVLASVEEVAVCEVFRKYTQYLSRS